MPVPVSLNSNTDCISFFRFVVDCSLSFLGVQYILIADCTFRIDSAMISFSALAIGAESTSILMRFSEVLDLGGVSCTCLSKPSS